MVAGKVIWSEGVLCICLFEGGAIIACECDGGWLILLNNPAERGAMGEAVEYRSLDNSSTPQGSLRKHLFHFSAATFYFLENSKECPHLSCSPDGSVLFPASLPVTWSHPTDDGSWAGSFQSVPSKLPLCLACGPAAVCLSADPASRTVRLPPLLPPQLLPALGALVSSSVNGDDDLTYVTGFL